MESLLRKLKFISHWVELNYKGKARQYKLNLFFTVLAKKSYITNIGEFFRLNSIRYLSKQERELLGEPAQMWQQYSILGRILLFYRQ